MIACTDHVLPSGFHMSGWTRKVLEAAYFDLFELIP